MKFEVVPIPDENYEGRQWGWRILKDGEPYFDCTTGGTGDCWNITARDGTGLQQDDDEDQIHICELDEAIGALMALRDSEAHRQNVARWAWPPNDRSPSPSA